jgi:hypothetical protein
VLKIPAPVKDIRQIVYCSSCFAGKVILRVHWIPCHHNMAHCQDTDGGDSLQIWRVVLNILSKKSEAADGGWSGGPPATLRMK